MVREVCQNTIRQQPGKINILERQTESGLSAGNGKKAIGNIAASLSTSLLLPGGVVPTTSAAPWRKLKEPSATLPPLPPSDAANQKKKIYVNNGKKTTEKNTGDRWRQVVSLHQLAHDDYPVRRP